MDKCREALSLTFDWARHQQELLNIVFPAMQEIASCLIDDRKPTREQVDKWGALLPQVTRRMIRLRQITREKGLRLVDKKSLF
jgi:hypothetical protein